MTRVHSSPDDWILYGACVRSYRVSKGKTQGEMARYLGVSIAYISDVERGTRGPFSEAHERRLCSFLGKDYAELCGAKAASFGAWKIQARRINIMAAHMLSAFAAGVEYPEEFWKAIVFTWGRFESDRKKAL